ncbi:MAG: DUF5654 family protein [Nanoarchaeota archaeon]|nr:DUF5654 family protein [Nanoarchaeota archaeon]
MDKIKKRIIESRERAIKHGRIFKKEIFNSTNTAIVAAFGFLIALTWKDVITEVVGKIEQFDSISGKLISALLITIICVAGILITTKLLSNEMEKPDYAKIIKA